MTTPILYQIPRFLKQETATEYKTMLADENQTNDTVRCEYDGYTSKISRPVWPGGNWCIRFYGPDGLIGEFEPSEIVEELL